MEKIQYPDWMRRKGKFIWLYLGFFLKMSRQSSFRYVTIDSISGESGEQYSDLYQVQEHRLRHEGSCQLYRSGIRMHVQMANQ